jgi:hypothetical protein
MDASPLDLDIFTWIGAAWFACAALALTSIWRRRTHSLKARVVWTAIVVLVPVLGAVAWFILGRERRRIR